MSTDPRAQHHVQCTECDRNAKYFCNTCTDGLCVECKQNHEYKHHDVVIYRDRKVVEFCNIHSNLPYIMCCKQCEVPVCKRCKKESHKKHSFAAIDDVFKSKKEAYNHHVSQIRNELLPKSKSVLGDIQSDRLKYEKELDRIQSSMTSKAQLLKDTVDVILAENTEYLQVLKISQIYDLQQQENIMNTYIAHLQNIVDEYQKNNISNKRAGFLLFHHKNPIAKLKDIPDLPETTLLSLTGGHVDKEDIVRMFGKIQETPRPAANKKIRNTEPATQAFDKSEKCIPIATVMMNFPVPGVRSSHYISAVTSDQAWIGDLRGHLVLTNMKSEKLNNMEYAFSYGCQTTSSKGNLIFLHKGDNGIYKVTANKTPKLVIQVSRKAVRSLYSSPLSGNILVGFGRNEEAKIIRYKMTGKEVYRIQYDNTGKALYDDPHYITENVLNGDICVSDYCKCVVVVVNKDRKYRFTYSGYPPASPFLPYGISTDAHGHILVNDYNSDTVQMIDKDGNFLSYLLNAEQGIQRPTGLSLDIKNSLLWVGQRYTNTVVVFRYETH